MSQQVFEFVIAIAVAIIAISFLVQAAAMLSIRSSVTRLTSMVEEIQHKAQPLINRIEPLMGEVQVGVSSLKATVDGIGVQARDTFDKVAVEVRAVSAAVSVSSRLIADLAVRQAEQWSSTMDQSAVVLQRQVQDLDKLLSKTQTRIDLTAAEVQTSVLAPMKELTALLAGVKRALELIFNRQRKQIDKAYQDEELFI